MRALTLILLTLLVPALTAGEPPDPRLERSRELSRSLGQQLKARLVAEMQRAGPVAAIEVCHVEAPEIAEELSDPEVSVGRTAPRVRNPANTPTSAQRAVLERFAAELQAPDTELVPEDFHVADDGSARYMRAIAMDAPCAACHGAQLAPAVAERIAELYPEDQATGFAPGDLRGAFLVTWPANPEYAR